MISIADLSLEGRYNRWGQREPIIDDGRNNNVDITRAITGATEIQLERDLLYQHAFTGCRGVEFVAYSQTKLMGSLLLPEGVILVPCFDLETAGRSANDPILVATFQMARNKRFIYDGWFPTETFSLDVARKAIVTINRALAVLVLAGSQPFSWRAKYHFAGGQHYTLFQGQQIEEIQRLSDTLGTLSGKDRDLIQRSIGWLARSMSTEDTSAAFLFAVLAIESLASAIINDLGEDSRLISLAPERMGKTQRKNKKRTCIEDVLGAAYAADPIKAIQTAYFDCVVGLKAQLHQHLSLLFGADSPEVKAFFEASDGNESLYQLRHEIAHGGLENLDHTQVWRLASRLYHIQNLAARYLLEVLKRATGFEKHVRSVEAVMSTGVFDMRLSNRRMYGEGPTEMAVIYTQYIPLI